MGERTVPGCHRGGVRLFACPRHPSPGRGDERGSCDATAHAHVTRREPPHRPHRPHDGRTTGAGRSARRARAGRRARRTGRSRPGSRRPRRRPGTARRRHPCSSTPWPASRPRSPASLVDPVDRVLAHGPRRRRGRRVAAGLATGRPAPRRRARPRAGGGPPIGAGRGRRGGAPRRADRAGALASPARRHGRRRGGRVRFGRGGPVGRAVGGPAVGRPRAPPALQAVAVAVATLAQRCAACPGCPSSAPPRARRRAGRRPPAPADAGVLHKVTSLLAKAESTTFPDEAEALTAKAQELMTRYAIDRAQLDAGRGDQPVAGGRRLASTIPTPTPATCCCAAVADANRCRAVWTRRGGSPPSSATRATSTPSSCCITSLLVQATRAMVLEPLGPPAAGRPHPLVPPRVPGGVRGARSASGWPRRPRPRPPTPHVTARRVVPLFEARRAAADRALGEAFPETRTLRVSARNAEGWQAGVQAADRAQLGYERPVPGPGPPGPTR